MKHLLIYLAIFVSLTSSFNYSQKTKNFGINKTTEGNQKVSDTLIAIGAITIRTINSFHVEENINQKFGGYTTTYKVSKESLIYTYDLGPNNSRKITPYYGVEKHIPIHTIKLNKSFLKSTNLAELALLNKNKREPIKSNFVFPFFNEADEKIITTNNEFNKTY